VVKIIQRFGSKAFSVQGNLTGREDAERVVDKMVEHFNRIDILVNYVGGSNISTIINCGEKNCAIGTLVHEISDERWNTIMDLNMKTAFYCVRATVPFMIQRKYGRIINVSSLSKNWTPWFVQAKIGRTKYAAANAGICGFNRQLAIELAEHNITVNCVVPRVILTPKTGKNFMALEGNPDIKLSPKNLIRLKRYGTPEEVACAIAFFATKDAGFLTGEELYVNGGLH
jgi:3-oxoacyl-[acyl-carrier protein] reductase